MTDRPCKLWGGEVTANDPDYPYCVTCHYSGRAATDWATVAEVIAKFRSHGFEAWVDQTGGGTMSLAVALTEAGPSGPFGYVAVVSDGPPAEWDGGGVSLMAHPEKYRDHDLYYEWVEEHRGDCKVCASLSSHDFEVAYEFDLELTIRNVKAAARLLAAHHHQEAA